MNGAFTLLAYVIFVLCLGVSFKPAVSGYCEGDHNIWKQHPNFNTQCEWEKDSGKIANRGVDKFDMTARIRLNTRNQQPSNWKAVMVEEEQKRKNGGTMPGVGIRDLDNEEDLQKGLKKMKNTEEGKGGDNMKGGKECGHAGHEAGS